MILMQHFSDFLYKSTVILLVLFEMHQLVEAIQMRTNNICLYKHVDKSTLVVI